MQIGASLINILQEYKSTATTLTPPDDADVDKEQHEESDLCSDTCQSWPGERAMLTRLPLYFGPPSRPFLPPDRNKQSSEGKEIDGGETFFRACSAKLLNA